MIEKIKKSAEYICLSSEDIADITVFAETLPCKEEFLKLCSEYEGGKLEHEDALKALVLFSKEKNVNEYRLNLAFILYCLGYWREKYKRNGTAEEIIKDTLKDVAFKVEECKDVKGCVGLFVFNWYRHFYEAGIVKLGRLQYHTYYYLGPDVTIDGVDIHYRDKVINVHIPGDGTPATQEACLDSYKKAYEYFDLKQNGKIIFRCSSWMLYPANSEIFSEKSNVVKFMRNYRVTKVAVFPNDVNRWRYFGKYADLPDKDLPEDTSLRRAYKKWILSGNYYGSAEGVFVFDGENIKTY